MFIADSTVAGNANGTFGGGIANFGKLTLQSVTVARNQVAGFTQMILHMRSLTLPDATLLVILIPDPPTLAGASPEEAESGRIRPRRRPC